MQENIKYNISSENSSKINQWLSKFPDDQKKPAIIYALHLIQKENKLPKITIPDFPLSCELLTELFFGKRPEKKT